MAIVTRGRGNDHMIDPVVQLMAHVINNEHTHHMLQIDLRPLEIVLQDIAAIFRDQQTAPPEIVKVWLQLLLNSLAEAKRVLDRSGRRQRCLDCVVNNPRRPSKQIREYWNKLFNDRLYHAFQSDLLLLVTSLQFLSSKPLDKEVALLQGVAASGFVGSGIIDAQAQVERWLNEGDRVRLIGVYGMPGVGKTSLLKTICHKYREVFRMIWVRIPEDYNISDLQVDIEDQIRRWYWYLRFHERKVRLSRYFKREKFCLVLDGLWNRLDLQELGVAFGDGINSKVLFSTCRKDLIGEMGAEESIEIQPLSREEAWMLFRRVAFKDDQVSMDIEARARQIADQCRGLPLAINVVATAMIGKTSVHGWDICLYSVKNVDPAFPGTHSGLNAELYRLLRWSYDTLPSSELKNCFLYCTMYKQDQEIDSRQLVQMWIGEGLVKSKQGIHIMDMAIGRSYVKLLVHRCLFQVVKESTDIFRGSRRQAHDVFPSIRIRDVIREMAVYIAQKEENCLFMKGQNPPNFQQAHYNNCRRISFPNNYIGDLPSDLRCPKLATLILEGNRNLELLSTEFVLSLTSLRVLNLSGCTTMTSVPTSVGQLRLLEFLSLSGLPIEDLGEEICHLPKLQFLDLSWCRGLKSLPSQIGELKNLKYLNLDKCASLEMIPREFSGLTSLSRLLLSTPLSVETEARASVWSLKGLQNLVELQVCLKSRPQDGIMGTWSEMRHLVLYHGRKNQIAENFPHDMQDMKKLQSLKLSYCKGPTFPNYKFEHLEMVKLIECRQIRELSALEWLPNLKFLKLYNNDSLSVLGIGTRVPSGYSRLEKLVLTDLLGLESLAGPSNTGVWDERTLPSLRVLKIDGYQALRRLPIGMEKLRNLCALRGQQQWWEGILWENDNMKAKLQKIFVPLPKTDGTFVKER